MKNNSRLCHLCYEIFKNIVLPIKIEIENIANEQNNNPTSTQALGPNLVSNIPDRMYTKGIPTAIEIESF